MPRFAVVLVLVTLFGCAKMPQRPAAEEKKYQLHGVIKRVDKQGQTVTIKHDAIKGWMEPMTMEFPVPSKEEFIKLEPGQTIDATVFVRDLDYHVGDIKIEAK